jgi:hypothetical protein
MTRFLFSFRGITTRKIKLSSTPHPLHSALAVSPKSECAIAALRSASDAEPMRVECGIIAPIKQVTHAGAADNNVNESPP